LNGVIDPSSLPDHSQDWALVSTSNIAVWMLDVICEVVEVAIGATVTDP
jgi:hypothetical protein